MNLQFRELTTWLTLRQSCSPTQIRGRSSELATVRSQRLVARALRRLTAQETPKNLDFVLCLELEKICADVDLKM